MNQEQVDATVQDLLEDLYGNLKEARGNLKEARGNVDADERLRLVQLIEGNIDGAQETYENLKAFVEAHGNTVEKLMEARRGK